jgi:uncharacterized protein YegJ (DUF2314 family)
VPCFELGAVCWSYAPPFRSVAKDKPETLITSGYDKQEMSVAIARAKAELPRFLAALKERQGTDFEVKVPITEGENTEHFWLVDITFDGEKSTGKIGNEPGMVSNVREGQTWTVRKDEISDWMFMRDGKMYGNYTMVPLLKTLPKEEADRYRSMRAEQ